MKVETANIMNISATPYNVKYTYNSPASEYPITGATYRHMARML